MRCDCLGLVTSLQKYPDMCAEPTIPYTAITRFFVQTNGSGEAAFTIAPGKLEEMYYNAPTFTASAVSAWGTAGDSTPMASLLAGTVLLYRVIGAHVKVSYVHSHFEDYGAMSLKQAPSNSSAWPQVSNDPTGFNDMAMASIYGPIRDGGYFVCGPATPHAYDWHNINADESSNTRSWSNYYGFVDGAPASTRVLMVEVTQRLELRANSGAWALLATPPAPDHPALRGAINTAHSKLSKGHVDIGFGTIDRAWKFLADNGPALIKGVSAVAGALTADDALPRIEL